MPGCTNISLSGRRERARGLRGLLCLCTVLTALAGALPRSADAQVSPSSSSSVLSHSGQFVIHADRARLQASTVPNLGTNRSLIRLEPALLGVSAERIKELMWRELGTTAPWRGRIYVELRVARAPNQTITITSERFKNGWQYRLELPDMVERDRYTRAIVQVLLLEFANRGSGGRLAEIPLWLTESLTQRLLASNQIEIILPPPRETVNGLNVRAVRVTELLNDPVAQARNHLRGQLPVTFDELSWQAEDQLAGDAAERYRASAQLFLAELLRLPDGRDCLRTMLRRLPQYLNWQLAFLEAFHAQFQRPLDVEKWWALCGVQAPKSEAAAGRTPEESWQALGDSLRTLAPAGPDAKQGHADVSLQTIIREWDRFRQTQALSSKFQELSLLRPQLSPDLALLAQEYCQAIEVYLQNQRWTRSHTLFRTRAPLSRVAEQTLQRLDLLDARWENSRPSKTPLAAGEVTAQPVLHP